MATLLICDDAVAFATLLQHWLKGLRDVAVVGVARSAQAAVEAARMTSPDIIVLDHRLGHETSEVVVPQLREASPHSSILLISGMADADLLLLAATSGADGFVSKAMSRDRLVDAVRVLLPR